MSLMVRRGRQWPHLAPAGPAPPVAPNPGGLYHSRNKRRHRLPSRRPGV